MATHELDDLEGRRNTAWLVADAGIMAGGVALFVYGMYSMATLPKSPPPDPTPDATVAIAGGVVLSAGFGMYLIQSATPASVTNHKLTRPDAERIAERYDRALLRKVTSDVEGSRFDLKPTSYQPVRIAPSFGLGTQPFQGVAYVGP